MLEKSSLIEIILLFVYKYLGTKIYPSNGRILWRDIFLMYSIMFYQQDFIKLWPTHVFLQKLVWHPKIKKSRQKL